MNFSVDLRSLRQFDERHGRHGVSAGGGRHFTDVARVAQIFPQRRLGCGKPLPLLYFSGWGDQDKHHENLTFAAGGSVQECGEDGDDVEMTRRLELRWALATILLAVLALGAHFGSAVLGAGAAETPRTPPAIPVQIGVAATADVPIYLSGLGRVQAANSVLVKSRVDGQIFKINFTEGQEVRVGDILAEIDPRPYAAALAQAKATMLKDQALLQDAELNLRRFQTLADQESIARQQLDTQAGLAAQLRATVAADAAQVDLAQLQLTYCGIRSPIDGRVGVRLVDAGNIVRANDTTGIVTINQIHPIFVTFALPATSLPDVRARFKAGAVPVIVEDATGRDLIAGQLATIDNQVSVTTATVTYKASFANADEALWPGQFVNIRLLLQLRRGALTVPVTTVVQGPEGDYVFVVRPDKAVEKRLVKVGFTNRALAIVEEGLVAGDRIVTDGQSRIQAGSRVEAMAP